MADERDEIRALQRAVNKVRKFPTHTDGCSRHQHMMADALADPKGRGYPMFVDEPLHCARTLYAVLLSLWGARLEREAVDKDAARYRFLQGLHRVRAQAYWWNYSSRRERNKAIDKAILEAAANNVSSTYSIEKP